MANFCSNCGKAVNAEMNFCPSCGKKLVHESTKNNSRNLLLTGLAALAGGAALASAGNAFAKIADAGTDDIYNFFGMNPLALENFTGIEEVADIDAENLENVEVDSLPDVENVTENISDISDVADIADAADILDSTSIFDDMDIF